MSELIIEDDIMRNQKSLMYGRRCENGSEFYNFKNGSFEFVEEGFMVSEDCILRLDIRTTLRGSFFNEKCHESEMITEIKKSKQSHIDNLNEIIGTVLAKVLSSNNLGDL